MAGQSPQAGWHRKRPFRIGFAGAIAAGAVLFMQVILDTERVRVTSAGDLQSYFEEIGYPAKTLRVGRADIPRIVVTDIPDAWADGLTVSAKKSLFYRALLPMVLLANEEILHDRRRLTGIREALAPGASLDRKDRSTLEELARRYRMVPKNPEEMFTERYAETLLRRVDIIPPSLALAQGAVESGYASSRFASEGNALFGQWTFGGGLVPREQRTHIGDYRVAAFDTPMDSVRSYMRNLNTNPAYRPFRDARARARARGERPRGAPLAGELQAYSEKGAEYVSLIRSVMAQNLLSATDGARLRDMPPVRIATGPI